MSMTSIIYEVSEEAAKAVLEDGAMVEQVIMADEFVVLPEGGHEFTPRSSPLYALDELPIEGSWHLIHFALTGEAWGGEWPKNFILGGGDRVGPDMGYGPVRIFTPAQVQEVAGYIAPLKMDELYATISIENLLGSDIYPVRDAMFYDDYVDEADHFFNLLKPFVEKTADAKHWMIINVS